MSLSFTHPLGLALLLALIPLVKAWASPNALTPQRKRSSLILRCLTVVCLVLTLAGTQVVTLTKNVSVIFLMDRSLSTGGDSQGWQREYAGSALRARDEQDQYGIVLFGKNSRIELPAAAHQKESVEPFSAVVDRSASGMTSALRFAATAFPGDSASRLVILSDGQSTEAETAEEAAALAAAGIEVWTVPMPDSQVKDLLISRLEAPNQIAVNEPFVLRTVIESAGISQAELLLSANGQPSERLHVTLRDGPNLFLIPQRLKVSGPVRYQARVLSSQDERQENNLGEALVVAGHEQSVLVLRSQAGPGALVPMLQRAGMKAKAVTAHELPRRVGAWRDVSALVVEDVSALDWSLELQKVVSLLVRDGGMGLVMLGSDQTFGVGGYQHTPIEPLLPVNLAIRRPKDMPLAALIQCLDKSGSMSGRPIEMAREAAIAAGETLSELDLLGVVGFDDTALWVYPFTPKGDGSKFKAAVGSLRAGGGTDLYPAFHQAIEKLAGATAPLKHIIILSDGATAPADFDGLLKQAVRERITVSAVALGEGADVKFLTELTNKGKGRLYVAADANGGAPLPQIFIREALLATGSGINDKPTEVRPTGEGSSSPLLADLQFTGSPRLAAYNMTSGKGGTATTLLQSPKKDPILAVGRAGLGKTAAWTSDLGGLWAASWLAAPGTQETSLLETILLRMVRSTNAVGDLAERSRGNQLEAQAQNVGDLSTINLRMVSREPLKGPVKVVVVDSLGESTEAVMHPETPFLATGSVQITEPGSSLVFAQDPDGQMLARCNLSIPLTPEFAKLGTNRELLKGLAQRSDGRFDAPAETVFDAPTRPFPLRRPLGFDLVRGALLLLLLEIAVRRLPIPKRLARATQSVDQIAATTTALKQQMSQLRETKRAANQSSSHRLPSKPKVQRAGSPPPDRVASAATPESTRTAPKSPPKPEESTLSRLREAKKRSHERPPNG